MVYVVPALNVAEVETTTPLNEFRNAFCSTMGVLAPGE
jgi:hypothetical protein